MLDLEGKDGTHGVAVRGPRVALQRLLATVQHDNTRVTLGSESGVQMNIDMDTGVDVDVGLQAPAVAPL